MSKKCCTFAAKCEIYEPFKDKRIMKNFFEINRALVAKKKVFISLLALSLVCIGFSSCDNGLESSADPTTQPIAGKTYRANDVGDGYVQFVFHMNYKCTMEAKEDGKAPVSGSYYEWWMSPNDPDVVIRYAQGAYDKRTGESLSGKEFLSGSYDATAKTVTLSGDIDGTHVNFSLKEQQ